MTNTTSNRTRGLVDAFLGEFGAEVVKDGDTLTDEMKWAMVAVSAAYVLYELEPFWMSVPKTRRNRLIAEYEKVVSEYTPEQVSVYLKHPLPEMKKKLIFYVAVARHSLVKITTE